MKHFVRTLLYLLMVTFVISCQKEVSTESSMDGSSQVKGVLKMKIDGKQWVADKVATASIMAGYINITGISKDKKFFTITLMKDVVKTYKLNPVDFEGGAALSDSAELNNNSYGTMQSDDIALAGGTVTVSKIDQSKKTISGTFQFKLFREEDSTQKVITEGVFEDLVYETTLPPSSSTDTFTVKIDGTDWKGESIFGTYVDLTKQIMIVANNSTATKTVGLTIPSNITPGSYTLDFWGLTYIGLYNPSQSLSLASESGTLKVLEHNTVTKRIRGTFDFKASELVPTNPPKVATLTNGYFSVKYQ
jgi:hypothetical protein